MTNFYHMSATPLAVGAQIPGNGKDKIDPRIEAELEARRPKGMLSRRDAVYARPVPDFSRCGIISAGYIYRVRLAGIPQRLDLNWLGPMQQALLKEKYIATRPDGFGHFPDWTDDLVERCCAGYWGGTASEEPVWECLAPSFTVVEVLSDRPVDVAQTRGGWPPSG
jgi:hypothetical protein